MRGNADTVKERSDIAEVLSGYLKLERAGANFKARCPFHNEKTASFFISTERQTFYCFGCGKKGDVFTFIEEIEGLDFKDSLKLLADKAGIELEYSKGENKSEKDKLYQAEDDAALFFESNLAGAPDASAYLLKRGISEESVKKWRLGFAPDDWRLLRTHMKTLGYADAELVRAGLVKSVEGEGKEPYDVFRGRVIFPLADAGGRIIAFSGRTVLDIEPKYLNSPDTPLFMKSEVLYGLDKAKDEVRKKNYAVLVEGQMDLVLSHQAGVLNTVASSGTAFTAAHLARLKRLSNRIILAFDGDSAGMKAAEKSSILGLSMGMEVKVAKLPEGKDPADVIRENPEEWKDILRGATHAIEHFLGLVIDAEKDDRKRGKEIQSRVLPLIALLDSSIERSHFVSVVAKRSGIRENVLWEDLLNVKRAEASPRNAGGEASDMAAEQAPIASIKERISERLAEVAAWMKGLAAGSAERELLAKEEAELSIRIEELSLEEELSTLTSELSQAEAMKDEEGVIRLSGRIRDIHTKIRALDEKRK